MITRRTLMGTTLAGCAGLVSCSQSEQPTESMSVETAASAPPPAEPPRYDPESLKKSLDAGEDVFLLDVRRPEELEEIGDHRRLQPHPDGSARSAHVGNSQRPPSCRLLKPRRTGLRAAALLEKNGYNDIQFGGVNEWKEKGYDVIHPKASELTAGEGEAK